MELSFSFHPYNRSFRFHVRMAIFKRTAFELSVYFHFKRTLLILRKGVAFFFKMFKSSQSN